jgi:3-deoxy-D-manno-octulosonate 8-phosphate phosphatase (KDO 8-P phosphatase)
MKPSVFILDVDGVLNTGKFFYSSEGKIYKEFGADDNDALALVSNLLEIRFISGDKRGFAINKKRIVDDMDYPLDLVSTFKRVDWIKERYDPQNVIYMGDGIFDYLVFKEVGYSICPASSDPYTTEFADFICNRAGGDRAVSEACRHILEKFFSGYNPDLILTIKSKNLGN